MAAPIVATMPPGIELDGGYVVRLAAISATDGSAVSGVNVSGVVITGNDLTGGAPPGMTDAELAAQSFGPFMLVPGPND